MPDDLFQGKKPKPTRRIESRRGWTKVCEIDEIGEAP